MPMDRRRAQTRDEKVLFAYCPANLRPDGVPILTFLMPDKAWEHMLDGRSHDFDLSRIGIPLKIIIGRCTDHADGLAMLETANGGPLNTQNTRDLRNVNVEIDPDEKARD